MEENKNFLTSPVTIGLLIAMVLCCCCIVITGAGLFYFSQVEIPEVPPYTDPTPSDDGFFPFDDPTPTQVVVTRVPSNGAGADTLETLESIVVPVNDPRQLAERLTGKVNIPETFPSKAFKLGDKKKFWASNVETNKNFEVEAVLRHETPHSYFWVQEGVNYNEDELKRLADAFETKIYPTNREFFGSEWSPGIDNDPHIYILYVRGVGFSIAGYFSSADEVHPDAHEYSNAHEMFIFNADNTPLGQEFTYGVLAHEFQHMIHWYQDRNETSWLNEGFSELAAFLNDYDPGGFDYSFTANPDLQLNDWPDDSGATPPHYGAGFLFTSYFLDRFGEKATQALVRHPENGLESVDEVLKEIKATDPQTGQAITADDFFADWVVANYLNNSSAGDGRYVYNKYKSMQKASATDTITQCPSSLEGRAVNQYGTDYIQITCQGKITIRFEGATQTKLLPADPHSGSYAFWSNKGDESDMTLTQEFDFSQVSGDLKMSYWTWYDLETDYDYLYLEASTDGGKTWKIIKTPSGTDNDPSGNSYGWGYNGKSSTWIQETINLSEFAGKKVSLRFEYVTDAAVNGEGLLLDDISIPAIGYETDFENDLGGWESAGFARIQNTLPQTFRLSLIRKGNKTTVETIELQPDQTAEIELTLGGGEISEVILTISGTTRFTREDGAYNLIIR